MDEMKIVAAFGMFQKCMQGIVSMQDEQGLEDILRALAEVAERAIIRIHQEKQR